MNGEAQCVTLDELYNEFISGIYGPEENSAEFVKAGALKPQDQLAIYRGSVIGGLVEALGDLFPAIKSSVGEKFFDAMARKYVAENPSKSYSLDHYGASFPNFIAEFKPLKDFSYLSDLALLEWTWHRCFHARDEAVFDPSSLANVEPENQVNICFEITQTLTVVESPYPLLRLWELNQPNAVSEELDLAQGGENVAVWRQGLTTRLRVISDIEHDLLNSMKKNESIGTIFASSLSNLPHDELNAALANFMRDGWIIGYQLDSK